MAKAGITPVVTPKYKAALLEGNTRLMAALTDDMVSFVAEYYRSPQERADFDRLRSTSGLSLDAIYEGVVCLRNMGNDSQRRLGRDLLRFCDQAGHVDSAIAVSSARLRQDTLMPGLLRAPESLESIRRVEKFAKQGHWRSMVVLGKIAERQGNEPRAIALYEKAIDAILSETDDAPAKIDKTDKPAKASSRQQDDLATPWIELGFLYVKRGETTKALEAYVIGTEQDDPMAFFNLARLDYRMSGSQYSTNWLYNMSKAAASGHFMAAYELGVYYAQTKAPPPVDEPKARGLLAFFTNGIFRPKVDIDPQANAAYYAAFAQAPRVRVGLALEWLDVASQHIYIPAQLLRARLYLQKHIRDEKNLDLELVGERDESAAAAGVKNPYYDVGKAKSCLATILAARETIQDARATATTSDELRDKLGTFTEFPAVLEAYEDKLGELAEEAERIGRAL